MASFIRKNYRFLLFAFALAIIVLSVIRIFVIRSNVQTLIFENTQQYRIETSSATTAFLIAVLTFLSIFLVFSLLLNKKKQFNRSKPYYNFTSALTGFILLSSAAYLLSAKLFFNSEKTASYIALYILMMLSSVYFIYNASGKSKEKDNISLFLSFIPSITIITRLIITFVSTTDYQTLSSYPYLISGLSLFLIFFINEGKFYIDKQNTALYFFFGLASMTLMSVYAIPDLMLRLFWELELNDQAVFSMIDIISSVYIFFRLFSLRNADQITAK